MRLPFLRSKDPAEDRARAAQRRAAPAAEAAAGVEAARTRARRRLAGALVLLVIGVVGFPIVFETQPRPLPVDTPIRISGGPVTSAPAPAPQRRGPGTVPPAGGLDAPAATGPSPTSTPAGRQGGGAVTAAEAPAVPAPAAATEPPPRPASAAAPAAPPAAADPAPAAPKAASASSPAATAAPAAARTGAAPPADEAARARALLEADPAASAAARWVVQVGAYTDAALLREARAKVEKAGLKTYTQVVENGAGKRTRVRLGPYATREEADAAAAKVKRTGLPAAIVKL